MILMNDLKKEYAYLESEIDKAVKNCFKAGWFIHGQNLLEFEQEFAKYSGTKYAIGVANGLEALQISLMALGIGEGDEVITQSNSFVATALAVSNVGAKPVLVECDEFFTIDVKDVEKKITKKTKAIIPVHLFGQVAAMDKLMKIAKKHNLKVIEDSCQAHGAIFKGNKAGSFGDLGCFSFYPTKNIGAYGDGGMITTNSKALFERCQMIANYGQKSKYVHVIKGMNSRLDEIQAGILRVKLKKLNSLTSSKVKIAKKYFAGLKSIEAVGLPELRENSTHVYHQFVIKVEDRDKLQKYLRENGVETLIHYPIPIHKQECYREFNNLRLPRTEKYASQILSLPIHPFLEQSEISKVIELIKNFYTEAGRK